MSFRLSIVEFSLDDPGSALAMRESRDVGEVEAFLAAHPQPGRRGRIFILERSGAYGPRPPEIVVRGIVEVLHDSLGTPEELFREHAAQGPAFTTDESRIRSSWLPSSMPAEESFHQDMFTMWLYTGLTRDIQWPCSTSGRRLCPGDEGLVLRCQETGREFQFYERKTMSERQRWLMITPQRCSYWSTQRDDGGWDAIILCDPPPLHALVNGTGGPVKLDQRVPFNGGYREFIPPKLLRNATPWDSIREVLQLVARAPGETEGGARRRNAINAEKRNLLEQLERVSPPRTAMFDDLRYYFCRHARLVDDRNQPSCVMLFPLKLIASHFCVVHDFVAFQTAKMRSTGWNLRRETVEQVRAAQEVETAWSRFRCTEYLEAVTAMLDTLGIAREDYHPPSNFYSSIDRRRHFPDGPYCRAPCCVGAQPRDRGAVDSGRTAPNPLSTSHYVSDWRSPIEDFLFLHRQFTLRREDYDRITTSIAALAGIIAGRLGIDEAKTAKALTFVAMCFAPLSWVSGIYSMENFGPDGSFFWQYWVTALPAMLAVWGVFFAWKYWAVIG